MCKGELKPMVDTLLLLQLKASDRLLEESMPYALPCFKAFVSELVGATENRQVNEVLQKHLLMQLEREAAAGEGGCTPEEVGNDPVARMEKLKEHVANIMARRGGMGACIVRGVVGGSALLD